MKISLKTSASWCFERFDIFFLVSTINLTLNCVAFLPLLRPSSKLMPLNFASTCSAPVDICNQQGLAFPLSDFHSKWYLNAFAGDCFYMAIFFPLAMFAYIYSKLMMKNWVDELFTSDHILSCTTSFCRGTLCKRSLSLSLSFEWAHFLPCRKAKVKWSWHWQGPICKTGFIGGLVVTIDLPCPTYSNKRQLDGFFYELQISEPTAPKGRCFEPNIWRNLKSHNHPNIFFCSEGL